MEVMDSMMGEAALRYAELGYRVFPCLKGTKEPIPNHGHLEATTDAATIERWWRHSPNANVAIATEGLLLVDRDGKDNGWPHDPERILELGSQPSVLTPHGGRHAWYRQPEGKSWRSSAGRLAPGVDVRADGGYVLVPPSVVDGVAYTWIETLELETGPEKLATPPPWLMEALDALEKPSPGRCGTDGGPIPKGQRNATLARLGGSMRRVGMTEEEITVALLETNRGRCEPPLSEREVRRVVASISRYEPDQVSVAVVENHWGQDHSEVLEKEPGPEDPGPLPEELLRVPGFVSEVMDFTLETAPYPNPVLAFGGALSLQAFLAGRRVRDPGDNRTNLYLLGLAHSASGKDWPRRVNGRVLHEVGLSGSLGERFASGEGLQDALFQTPAMLFQTDEIDGLLLSINKAQDARHEGILGTLLTMYSSASAVVPMRRKAGQEQPGVIDQPNLVLFGTAIPTHYYASLSERMLTNGLVARMLTLESFRRSRGQEPKILTLPERVLKTAHWWAQARPGGGNLSQVHPVPRTVPQTEAGRRVLIEAREAAEAEYALCEGRNDAVGTTVWGRVNEHARKLALIYAVSENREDPKIGDEAARWAVEFVDHHTRRMLFMAESHLAESAFQADCLKVLRKLREAEGQELAHSVLLKRMKMDAKSFRNVIATLSQRGDIEVLENRTAGRTGTLYRLIG